MKHFQRKNFKHYLILSLLVIMLILASACADKEDNIPDKPSDDVTEQAVVENPEQLWTVKHENELISLAISTDGNVAIGENRTVYCHRIADGLLDEVYVYQNMTDDLAFSPDGALLGVGFDMDGIWLTDTANGNKLSELHNGFSSSRVAFSSGGQMATGNSDGKVRLWDIKSGEQLAALKMPSTDWITSLTYDQSGKLLAASQWTDKGTVTIWDIESKEVVHSITLNNYLGGIKDPFQFSPDGKIMAAAIKEEYKHLVRLWMSGAASPLADLSIPDGYRDMDFSPDSSLLAVASLKAVTIWDVSTHTLLYTLDQTFSDDDTDTIVELAFTPDSRHLAVARKDGRLDLWRLPGAEPFEAVSEMRMPNSLPSDAMFGLGSSQLKGEAALRLEAFAKKLTFNYSKCSIKFVGHTDSSGTAEENLRLSKERAEAVRSWFENWANKNGAVDWTFSADGRGESELIIPDTDANGAYIKDAAAINRRIGIEVESATAKVVNLADNQPAGE